MSPQTHVKSFKERVDDGDTIICAEGYVCELTRRGYVTAGPYVPEVLINNPELVEALHREFTHAGSDINVACLYYVNKSKLRQLDLIEKFEKMNRDALRLCNRVSRETGTISAGNLCNSVEFDRHDDQSIQTVRDMFREQVVWAVEEGVDIFVCETFREYAECQLALDVVKEYAPGTPTIMSLAPYKDTTSDDLPFAEALNRLYYNGATVAGLNCARGPPTMAPLIREIRREYKGPMSVNPLPYRTTPAHPTWSTLPDPETGLCAWPDNLDTVSVAVEELENFGVLCKDLNINNLGVCCGNNGRLTRALTLAVGKHCDSRKYSSQTENSVMTKHIRSEQNIGVEQNNMLSGS